MKRYFIIGTDTNCGKTYAACQLMSHFQKTNKRALAIKPVASGCSEEHGELVNEDVVRLQQANSFQIDISPWRFKAPISPHLAAAEMGQQVTAKQIVDFCYDDKFDSFDYLLIESAGGLLCPLNDHETWLDVLVMSKIPVFFIVGMRLGCLNHALLTSTVLLSKGIECVGWIANCVDAEMLALPENIATLSRKLPWPLVGTIPYQNSVIIYQNLNL